MDFNEDQSLDTLTGCEENFACLVQQSLERKIKVRALFKKVCLPVKTSFLLAETAAYTKPTIDKYD